MAVAEEEKDAGRCRWLDEAEEFTCKIFDKPADENQLSKKKYTKWFDYDKIKDKLCVRGRQSGDYFYLNAVGGRKKIKQYFIDEKIPREQREGLLLVAENSHILWIVGYRISAGYKVTEGTRRILEIKYNGGREDE